MQRIEKYNLPSHLNTLYEKEASSAIHFAREIAEKVNELISAFNELSQNDLEWKQTQEGTIRKGVLFMKDNLINSLNELLKRYQNDTIGNVVLETYGKELNYLRVFATPQMFGAIGDGMVNDIAAIENAIASLDEGGILYFPKGTYLMKGRAVAINKANITFSGDGLIRCDYGFRLKASHFKAEGLRMEALSYSQDCRAFMIDQSAEGSASVEGFTFKDCSFENFFYSVCAIGGAYSVEGTPSRNYPVRDIVIENCYSKTFTDQNAGHFQCIQVENISYINNRTYGGKNASSYNAIQGNGFIRVIGNYDHDNSYASCEIENGSAKVIVANNTFRAKIWIDDSFDVVVNANTTEEGILVSVGSNNGDAENVIISNNACKNIRCEQFGTYIGGIINHVNIIGNNVRGTNTHGIWMHGNAVKSAKVCNNFITGENTNDIAIQRNEQLECYVHNNFGNGKVMLIAGSGGKVYAVDNLNMTSSGSRDALFSSHLERSFNGLKVADSSGQEWRINVSTSGAVTSTKY